MEYNMRPGLSADERLHHAERTLYNPERTHRAQMTPPLELSIVIPAFNE